MAGRRGKVLPYMDNTGMYRRIGYGFLPLCPNYINSVYNFVRVCPDYKRGIACTTANCLVQICLYFEYTIEITI